MKLFFLLSDFFVRVFIIMSLISTRNIKCSVSHNSSGYEHKERGDHLNSNINKFVRNKYYDYDVKLSK